METCMLYEEMTSKSTVAENMPLLWLTLLVLVSTTSTFITVSPLEAAELHRMLYQPVTHGALLPCDIRAGQ